MSEEQAERMGTCYVAAKERLPMDAASTARPTGRYPPSCPAAAVWFRRASDYLRSSLQRGRTGRRRILGRKTVEYMTSNHLPTGATWPSMGQRVFSETTYEGIGFGLGFSVMLDPVRAAVVGSIGEYVGGAASTMFWVDPEELVGMLFTQLIPSSTYPLRREMKALTYQP